MLLHGVAFLSWNQHPEPKGSRRATPLLPFNIPRDNPCLLADTGYFSAANVAACDKAGIEPLIAMGRQPHHPPLAERFQAAPEAPQDPTPVEAMAHRLTTPAGRALYALRKQMPEPVFGVIKSALGFRQFSLRGLAGARGEWSLVTMAWNIKRIFACVPA